MTRYIEICLEELDRVEDDECFVRCVAVPGGEPGLALDREGKVRWMPEAPEAYGLWTSADDRLVLLREEGSAPIIVERDERSLEAPVDQPVVLLDGDLLRLDGRRFKVYVHGETEAVYAPERMTRSSLMRWARAAAAAATVAIGGLAVSASAGERVQTQPIEVRAQPPVKRPPRRRVAIICTINKQKAVRGKGLRIHATCADYRDLNVGMEGSLINAKKGEEIPNGTVKIKEIKKSKIVVEAPKLTKPVKNAKLRFFVYRYW